MDEKLFTAFLMKTLNLSKEQVTELVKTEDGTEIQKDALKNLLAANSDHVKTLIADGKPDTKEFFNNGYAKGKEEVLGNFETSVLKQYGIKSDKKGLELIDAVVAEKTKAIEAKEITADDVQKHDVYRNMVTKMTEDNKIGIEKVTKGFEEQIAGFKKAETFKSITAKADLVINKLNPVFSENPTIAQNQRKTIHDALKNTNFEIQDSGTIVPVDADNKALKNEHGHPIEFNSVVENVTKGLFDLKASTDRSSAGGDDGGGDGGSETTEWTGTAPKNDEEYLKMMGDAKTQEEKSAITKAYEKASNP